MATAEQMCDYSDIHGYSRSTCPNRVDDETFLVKAKRVRCPECGRSMFSMIKVCHDGCCVYHCIPRHKKKGWQKVGKTKKVSRDNVMNRR